MIDESQTVLFDVGSGLSKIGISGEIEPNFIFQTIIETPKYANSKDQYVGDEVKISFQLTNIYFILFFKNVYLYLI